MSQLNLKPAHKSVQDYYKVLGQYGQLNIDHEMAVRSAFQGLLRTCARQFDWTLVPENPVRWPKAMPLKVDGALLDIFRLGHGFWESQGRVQTTNSLVSISSADENISINTRCGEVM